LLEYRSSVILLLVSELDFKVSTAQSGLLFWSRRVFSMSPVLAKECALILFHCRGIYPFVRVAMQMQLLPRSHPIPGYSGFCRFA
jgi:hypothetical protein